ncbi:MAG: diguanylate cyclase [Candidatus Cloacimonetes bacterium]|jgi:diguanylate cyclase (GGDEF)-like protein|nr:diguanylate cyclase [Candidatus Cloacimonadota bacterium]
MGFNLLSFDDMLRNLLKKQELEEHLSHIIRNIEDEFDFQSMGVYLKVPNSEIFRMKISRNISHKFAKNTIFTKNDPMIKEIMNFKLLDVHFPGRYKFEKEYSHLLVHPLNQNDELLGFMFIDKFNEEFESEEMTKIKLFASIISLIVQLYLQSNELEQHRGIYEAANIYSYKAFVEKSNVIFSMMKRYDRYLTIAVIKIENFKNIIRTIGEHETNDLITKIAYIIQNDLRETDIIGKIHEDTIAVLMPETSSKNGSITINRVNDRIMKLPKINVCRIDWGIASKDDNIKSAQKLIKFAEQAANDSYRKEEGNITIYK